MGVTDHPDYRAFVRRIRANPADDTVRLVAADWLDEHGEPEWAEFVRLDVELVARYGVGYVSHHPDYPDRPSTPDERQMRWRALRLWNKVVCPQVHGFFGPEFAVSDADSWGVRPPYVAVSRGFLHTVACSAAAWVAHGDAVLARQPVERVRLTTWPDGALGAGPNQGLHDRWPGVVFELPPTFTAEAGEDLRRGQLVWQDEHGRVRPVVAPLFNPGPHEVARWFEERPPVTDEQWRAMMADLMRSAGDGTSDAYPLG